MDVGGITRGGSNGVTHAMGVAWYGFLSVAGYTSTFLRLLHDTHLAFSFRTRGWFVAMGFYYGCAWCLATRGLREWRGLLEAVPQTTDHPG